MIASVEPPGREPGVDLQRVLKAARVDAQVRAVDVLFVEPRVRVQVGHDRAAGRDVERVAAHQRVGVRADREGAHLGDEAREIGRVARDFVVIPRDGGFGR